MLYKVRLKKKTSYNLQEQERSTRGGALTVTDVLVSVGLLPACSWGGDRRKSRAAGRPCSPLPTWVLRSRARPGPLPLPLTLPERDPSATHGECRDGLMIPPRPRLSSAFASRSKPPPDLACHAAR